jgi:intracellular multiplication protein IcmD
MLKLIFNFIKGVSRMNGKVMKNIFLFTGGIILFCMGTLVYAQGSAAGIGAIASTAKSNLGAIAELITAGSYVAGMGFAVAAITGFKAHKDNPTQSKISAPIVLLFVAAALLYAPSVFKSSGATLFSSGVTGGITGITSF